MPVITASSFLSLIARYVINGAGSAFTFRKTNQLKGYYLVCSQEGIPFVNCPDRTPNFLKIDTSIRNPKVLNVVSKDYCRHYARAWKTWRAEITLTGKSGQGNYIYDEGAEPGIHNIVLKDENTIVVRVTDLGKADLKNRKDNEPATQVWKRIPDHDPILKSLKKMIP